MISAFQLAVLANAFAILFVVALSLQSRRYYNPDYLQYWILAHVWEAALILCDLPHLLKAGELLPAQLYAAALSGSVTLWYYTKLGSVLARRRLDDRWFWPVVASGCASVLLLEVSGVGGYNALTPILLACLACTFWLGCLFTWGTNISTRSSAAWLGVPLLIRSGFAPFITLVGPTSWVWTNYAAGAALHLITGAGMAIFMMREGLEALKHEQELHHKTNRLQQEFLGIVSHELKTPLAVISQGAHNMVLLQSPKERAEVNHIIQERTQDLSRLITSIVDYAKLESGNFRMTLVTEDLGLYLQSWMIAWELLVQPKQQTLQVHLDEAELRFSYDPALLQQAIENLIGNAVKFTPRHGVIRVAVRKVRNRVVISVQDNGPGIAAEDQEVIFQKFKQLEQMRTRHHGGTGLGLAICKEIVEHYHHGQLWVESLPGQGANFQMAFPCS